MPKAALGRTGKTVTEFAKKCLRVLDHIHKEPFSIRGDYARMYAMEIASLASHGDISTFLGRGKYSNKWLITAAGIDLLTYNREVFPEIFNGST